MADGPVLARVSQAYEAMTRAERRIADVLLADPSGFYRMPMARLEARCAVSAPSIMRFCRALGYAGLTDLKFALAAAVSPHAAGGSHAPMDLLAQADHVIRGLRERLDGSAIEAAAALLATASCIDCLASHQLALAAAYARDAFLRNGRAAVTSGTGQHSGATAVEGDERVVGLYFCQGMPDSAMFDMLVDHERQGRQAVVLSDMALPPFIPAAGKLVLGQADAPAAHAGTGASVLLAHCLMVDILLARMAAPRRGAA